MFWVYVAFLALPVVSFLALLVWDAFRPAGETVAPNREDEAEDALVLDFRPRRTGGGWRI